MPIRVFAPAKINLALHVTGRRADGYHDLDSLVAFAEVGDRISVEAADSLTLQITGPQAAGLSAGEDNLVLRAARLMPAAPARITLEKLLPLASGIGGGSADAAATLRALAALTNQPLPDMATLLRLGADVPVCLFGQPCRMTGVGEAIIPLAHPLPQAALVLVNPGIALPTPSVFAALSHRDNAPMPPELPDLSTLDALVAFLHSTRNDLEVPAIQLAPVIAQVKAALAAQPDCLLTRMSGSGATCFGIFAYTKAAVIAANSIAGEFPLWWVAAARQAS